MKLNSKGISIPPYLSTAWKNVISLGTTSRDGKFLLVVLLNTGERVEIPDLESGTIAEIFESHARYIENDGEIKKKSSFELPLGLPLPFKINNGNLEAFGAALQHNPEQSHNSPLPPDLLKKLSNLSKTLNIEDPNFFPKPVENCGCLHCQIAKALHQGMKVEDEVSAEDLKFKNWDIQQINTRLYNVTNPLDKKEQYNVYLGTPIGCTCGEKNCEHIRAVLES